MSQFNRPHADNKLNELKDPFLFLNQHEHLNNLERKGKYIMTKRTKPLRHTRTDHMGEIKQCGNRQKDTFIIIDKDGIAK